jgi:D-beta-D-heptose 7-phosphate kinase/D-beta-D-heptose 1-phosphate adenosyltransferase
MSTQAQKKFNILLIGDNCTDVYQYGTVDRVSPEAPVPVFVPRGTDSKPGMAGNVYANLVALGCNVNFLHGKTSTKTRLIDSRSKQHIVRIDDDQVSSPLSFASEIPDIYDAIVISDYNKGTVSYELIEELRKEFVGPIFVDTKKTDLKSINGCYIKINQLEAGLVTSVPDPGYLIITMGAEGAFWNGFDFDAEPVEVADVCGAGDTFLSALTYEYLNTKNMEQAIEFAIRASAVTVQHLGNYAPTLEEIK